MTNEIRIMTQQRGGAALAQHIPCTLYNVNLPIEMMASTTIPVDWYELYTDWVTLTVQRGDYFIDEVTGAQYSVYGRPALLSNNTEILVTIPTGVIP